MAEQSIGDIEKILQWAYSQTVYAKHQNASVRSLEFNYGYTVIPSGCHSSFAGGSVSVILSRDGTADAKRIIDAVNSLDPWTHILVERNAKNGTRPDCFLGVEAIEVEVKTYPRRKSKKNGKKRKSHTIVITKRWQPCSPTQINATREIYARWHAALVRLAAALQGELSAYSAIGFAAPAAPWELAQEEAA